MASGLFPKGHPPFQELLGNKSWLHITYHITPLWARALTKPPRSTRRPAPPSWAIMGVGEQEPLWLPALNWCLFKPVHGGAISAPGFWD